MGTRWAHGSGGGRVFLKTRESHGGLCEVISGGDALLRLVIAVLEKDA